MSPTRPPLRRAAALCALASAPAAVLAAALALAQTAPPPAPPPPPPDEPQIRGVVTGTGGSRIPIALADPETGARLSASREMLETIRADLEFTGYFDVLPRERNRLALTGQPPGAPPLQGWLSIGADFLLASEVTEEPGRLGLTARLLDTRSGEMAMGKRYGGEEDLARRIAHRVSDDIVRQLTGHQGIALSRLAYVARTGPQSKEIYLMDYDGARPRRLTRTGTLCLSPAWSPDGEKLAYISFRGRQPGIDIVDRDGKISRLPTSGGDLNSAPDWSPDGRKIAYSSNRDGNSEIYVMDLASGSESRLTWNAAIDTAPCWSPTGREIAFTSSRAGNPQIYVMDASGGNVRRLTDSGSYNDSAAWAGDRIAYASRLEGRFRIFVHDLAAGQARQITFGAGNDENPRWSPDGRHIVFSSSRSGDYRIYTMGADGSNIRALTSGEPAYTPDWSR